MTKPFWKAAPSLLFALVSGIAGASAPIIEPASNSLSSYTFISHQESVLGGGGGGGESGAGGGSGASAGSGVEWNLNLASAVLPEAEKGTPYNYDLTQHLTVEVTSPPLTQSVSNADWRLESGALPPGLSLSTTGQISGTPTAKNLAGSLFEIVATHTDKEGVQSYTIKVNGSVLQVVSIAGGQYQTCAITTSGGVKCWGDNAYGQLGDGTTTQRTTPVDVVGLTSGVASISAGVYNTCVVTTSGGAKCWGNNGFGQLGDGTTTQRTAPVSVSGLTSGVAKISTRGNHTCAVTTSGGAKCWGRNNYGQLGDGTTTERHTPVNVSGLTSGVASIAPGYDQTCAVTTSGGVRCWGSNNSGRLGDGTTTSRLTPVSVSGLTSGVVSITGSYAHTCALTTSGGVKCWGNNSYGSLGDGTTTNRYTPVNVSGLTSEVASIAGGQYQTCAVTTSGGAKCWGQNTTGQLGDGTTIDRTTPVDVSGLTSGVAGLAGGSFYTCAVTTSGGAKCWGDNLHRQLGDGTTTRRYAPVDVGSE